MRRSASGQASAISAQQHGFESHTSHHLCLRDARNHARPYRKTRADPLLFLPVAQLDERPATNREVCRFDPCREGQFNRV